MFGSKLRSWMENHIVRPRKKGNKNKNNGTSNLQPTNTSNGHKGTSIQGDASTISSPARRSEVSPIQNHKTSRAGWQSPQDDLSSKLQSDEYPFRHTVSSSSPKKLLHKSSYTLEKNNSCTSTNNHLHPNYQQYSKSAGPNQYSQTIETNYNDSSDIRQSRIHHLRQNNTSTSNYPTSSSSTSTSHYDRISLMDQSHQIMSNNAGGKQIMENQFPSKSLSGRGENRVDATAKINKFEHDRITSAGRRDEYQADAISDRNNFYSKQLNEQAEHLYGKIQSRTFSSSVNGSETPSSIGSGNYDRCNANIQLNGGTKRCDNSNGIVMNCVNNNNFDGGQLHHFHQHNGINNNMSDNLLNDGYVCQNKMNLVPPIGSAVHGNIRRSSGETNRNMLRTNRYNGSHLSAPGTHQLAHMMHTLSSPESAYSTGYSTDGTSPGATYTPEYYINMRTGTHYFPRGVSSVVAVEQSRHKFGLNKIDEGTGSEAGAHRRTESCDLNRRSLNNGSGIGVDVMGNGILAAKTNLHSVIVSTGLSPDLQRRLALQNYKGMESPSPRQRCRIRTNPWFQAIDPTCIISNCGNSKKIEMDTSSTSSGIKSSSEAGTDEKNGAKILSSESESSSSTEIDLSKKLFTPNTIRKRRELVRNDPKSEKSVTNQVVDSDEDATLNEMMGKFDESYCYEKETDILSSDSDPTECVSDLDTGQDGGDECDTDELLDIDFIDNGSIQEIIDKKLYENTGSCCYVDVPTERRLSRTGRSQKQTGDSGSGKRRKRLTRTRKRSGDCRDNSCNGRLTDELASISCDRVRGSKSLNSTPVSLRRNKSGDSKCTQKIAPLANRSNSLTFTEIHSIRSRFLAIAESEKALIKADLEADVKYKQLIHEAETILVSMKTTTTSSATNRETPVPSPRRMPTLPTNKRVEMLRNCEADLRRELAKAQKLNDSNESNRKLTNNESSCADAPLSVQQDNLLINKRIELLRFETTSAPNSPKSGRFCPRKTHVSNFICQNISPTDLIGRKNSADNSKLECDSLQISPQLHLNGRRMLSPPKSPTPRRRFRSQSPRVAIESDTDSDTDVKALPNGCRKEVNGNKEKRKNLRKAKPIDDNIRSQKIDELDILNQNLKMNDEARTKAPMMSFRSIDMGNKSPEIFYCPQSEPLKRKIYSCNGSKTLEKLQQTLDMDPEISKKALLHKISLLRRDRKAAQTDPNEMYCHADARLEPVNGESGENGGYNHRRQLILNTIADLKRSLEDQSVELCGLNDDVEE